MQLTLVFETLYKSVTSGEETYDVLEANSAPDYKEKLEAELKRDARIRDVADRRGCASAAPRKLEKITGG